MVDVVSVAQVLSAYLIGSIPTGWLVARYKGVRNIRNHGSGTMGATNVARVLGTRYFFVVFLLDVGKAAGTLWLLRSWSVPNSWLLVCAGALLLGNTRSIFLRFKGGKGVATSFGLLLVLQPLILIFVLLIWLMMLWRIRIVGIASVAALLSAPVIALLLRGDAGLVLFVAVISWWCMFLHRDNLKNYFMTR